MEHIAKGQFVYCTNVFTLPLGSESAAQQPSYPCEAYAEQAQRKLPLYIQATVMVSAALAACWQCPNAEPTRKARHVKIALFLFAK